jgi:hypothetical protein
MLLLTALILAAAPAPKPLPDIPEPLGHFGAVVEAMPAGGLPDNDRPVLLEAVGCPEQAVYLMRSLGGTIRAVEQLQQWLARSGLERTLFARKQVLAGVIRTLSDARAEPRMACEPIPLKDGYRLELAGTLPRFCDAPPTRSRGDFWFFTREQPAAVISVVNGQPDLCKPRVSTVLFDPQARPRVRLHLDLGGVPSLELLGDKCQVVEFTYSADRRAYLPTLRSCKR